MSSCFSDKIFCGTLAFFAPWRLELLRRSNREGAKSAKNTRRNLFASALLLLASTGVAQSRDAIPGSAPEQGRKIYTAICEECHGPKGRGDGPKARKMGFRPRDFSLGSFKCRCTASGDLPTDEDLIRSVSRGMPGTPMQAHDKNLSSQEIHAVIQYIKTLSPRFEKENPSPCISIPGSTAPSERSVAEGRQIYRLLQCWKCHGKSGRGDGPAAAELKDDWGQPIKAYNFTVMKKFKCGMEDRDLYRTLQTGMNGSPMPSYAATFLFVRENLSDISILENYFGAREAQELSEYMRQQPDSAALNSMPEPDKRTLIDRRIWALIHYLRSLLAPATGRVTNDE